MLVTAAVGGLVSSTAVTLSFSARAKTTVPTGFFSDPPPGPAMPVIATATSAPLLVSAPCAIAQAQATETLPNVSITSELTPSRPIFASFA